MSGPLIDCYVLAPVRSAQLATSFLNHYLPDRIPSFDPDDPIDVLGISPGYSESELLGFLENDSTLEYVMYWRKAVGRPRHGIVAFGADGCMILGLCPDGCADLDLGDHYLSDLKQFASSPYGYWGVEVPPAMDRADFLAQLQQSGD